MKKPASAPMLASAEVEAMRRSMTKARKNLERIVAELRKLGYAFASKTPLGRPASPKTVAAIEKAVGGPLPVSLRMALQETIVVPDGALDARVIGVKGQPLLLDRLREAFRHGGFPGLAGKKGKLGTIRARLTKVCTAI
jgi:hypothetical protein